MASESAEPRAPQTEVVTQSTTNNRARVGPYTDTAITRRNVAPTAPVPEPLPGRSGSRTLGEIKVYDGPGTDHAPGDQGAVPPAHAPNSWPVKDDAGGIPRGRDLYANHGVLGQDEYLRNQGEE